jgi:hypothetical protein
VFEIYDRLILHINNNNILVDEQYGFRSHWSTEKAAFTITHKILIALDSKKTVGGIFCEFQKASDCVNHAILLQKLEFYGIIGKFKSLIGS